MKKNYLVLIFVTILLSFCNFSTVYVDECSPTISEPMTASQIVAQYAKDNDLSIAQASLALNIDHYERAATRYRTISDRFFVTSGYQPSATFYCQTSESGTYHGIVRILASNINSNYQGVSKHFSGNLYTNLERSDTIFYIVNGNFYNRGRTTVNAGTNIGVGDSANVNFGVPYSIDHYKYIYLEKRVHF